MGDQYSVLVVDDDEILCNLLNEALRKKNYAVHLLNNGEAIENVLNSRIIHLLILDILLPGKDGLYWLQRVHQQHPELPVLMLSAQHTAQDRIAGLELGAKDYLTKPFEITELLLRVKNLLESYVSPGKLNSSYFDPEQAVFFKKGQAVKLTITEVKILNFFYQHKNQIVSRDALSEALRGSKHHPLDRSIDVHINRLRNKIEEQPSLPKLLSTVWGKGYRFIRPEDVES